MIGYKHIGCFLSNQNIPGTENPWALMFFPLFVVGILVVQMLWFRWKKWF